MKDIKRLAKYLEDVKAKVKETQGEKKAFFEREVRKTAAKIEELSK